MEETWIIEDKYEVISKIKQGGFGIVYYGFDRKFEKPVAIKAIEPTLLQEAKYIDMFLKEAKNAAKLNHNNIVHIYDLIKTDDGQFYIIMEYIDGVDLGYLLKKCKAKGLKVPLELGIYIIKEICKALEYAHNKIDLITNEPLHLVHQDVSPSNIMISVNGNVKLIDFGIAKIKFYQNGDQRNLVLAGKLPYMSPEQLNGSTIDKRSDLFSLGSVLYEVLTGNRLFQFDDNEKTFNAVKKGHFNGNLLNQQEIPEPMKKILIKALQKETTDRYQGANRIYIDLVEFLMTLSQSVELSKELGEFVKNLFSDDSDGKNKITEHDSINEEEKTTKEFSSEDVTSNEIDFSIVETTPENEQVVNETSIESTIDEETNECIEEESTPAPVFEEKRLPAFSPSNNDEEESEDDIKTVIDVIRLSAKSQKKPLIFGSIGVTVAVVIFMIFNVSFGWTGFGKRIYNYLFPPAIKIYSTPQGAEVYIDDKLVDGKTPVTIPKIAPGVHKLALSYPGFPVLTRSFQVPSKGAIKVAGEKTRKGYEPYLFRFKTKIELNSDPVGATVHINNITYKQKTPTTIEWECGIPLTIKMSKPKFRELTGFSLNTLNETVEIEDRRLWNFTKIKTKYIVEGLFKKFVKISSVPSNVNFYLDGSPKPTGKTGSAQTIALSVGKHDILFTKSGFNSKRISVKVDENGPESIFAMLTRNVWVYAKDMADAKDNDIGATITRIYRKGKSFSREDKTPCQIALPPIKHRILVRKEGFKDAVVAVSPSAKVVVVRMEPDIVIIDVTVVDALTNLPLKDAQISYSSTNNGEEVYFGFTDKHGKCINKINPGQYTFKVKKFRYFEKSAKINTYGGKSSLKFKLIIQ